MFDTILNGLSMVVNTFGSMIVIPVILFFISLAFGIKANKAVANRTVRRNRLDRLLLPDRRLSANCGSSY